MDNSFQTEVYNEIKMAESQQLIVNNNCFVVREVNEWIESAKKRPIPNMLFDAFWYEKEICILFADTNVGKSILAVQICDSITKGLPIDGFRLEVKPQKLVYFDFELSDKQFEKRYSNDYQDHYKFSENFLRAEINPEVDIPKNFSSFEDYLISSLIDCIKLNNPSVLVIDNITYLKDNNEKAKDALPLMKQLKTICKNHGISILVLAHTPKRDSSKPLSRNDLAGSKMLINFCDSAFAIGESATDAGVRYLKQIKQRNTECVYHANSVASCQIVHDFNFLKFQMVGLDEELTHLKQTNYNDNEARDQEILKLKVGGLPNTAIAKKFGVSEGTVRHVLKKNNNVS